MTPHERSSYPDISPRSYFIFYTRFLEDILYLVLPSMRRNIKDFADNGNKNINIFFYFQFWPTMEIKKPLFLFPILANEGNKNVNIFIPIVIVIMVMLLTRYWLRYQPNSHIMFLLIKFCFMFHVHPLMKTSVRKI